MRNRAITASAAFLAVLSAVSIAAPATARAQGDALVRGTNFHATGIVRCATFRGGARDCEFGVIRVGNGSAAVTIRKPNGALRTIVYRQGSPFGYDQDVKRPVAMTWRRQGDDTTVRIGQETYVIPDAVVFGG